MNPEVHSLIHKEWHERRLPLAVCCSWILCCAIYVVAYDRTHTFRAPVAAFYSAIMTYTLFASIFLAMKTALGEHEKGTFGFSRALPISIRRLAWIKLLGGVLTLVLPIILGAILMTPLLGSGWLEQVPIRPPSNLYVYLPQRHSLPAADAVGLLWTITAITSASGVQLFLVLSIIGTRLRSESQIGFCGAILAFGWTIFPGLRMQMETFNGWLGALFPASFIINYGIGVEAGSYSDLDLGQPLWAPLAVNILVLWLLALGFSRRYGLRPLTQQSGRTPRWRIGPAVWSRIPIPLPNPIAALVWINLRQSLPVAIFGFLLAALFTFTQFPGYGEESFMTQLPSSTWAVAMLWAVVVGAGIFAAELQPKLSSFWRSRPVTVGSWFWCKFFTGLFAVLMILDGVTIFVSWGTPIGYSSGLSWSYIACMPIIHATLHAGAVLGVCWTRRPVVGGILALVAYFVFTILVTLIFGESFDPIEVHNYLLRDEINGQLDLTKHYYPLIYGMMAALAVISSWLASRAIRQPEGRELIYRRHNLATKSNSFEPTI